MSKIQAILDEYLIPKTQIILMKKVEEIRNLKERLLSY